MIYTNPFFTGKALTITKNDNDLNKKGWDNKASAIKIYKIFRPSHHVNFRGKLKNAFSGKYIEDLKKFTLIARDRIGKIHKALITKTGFIFKNLPIGLYQIIITANGWIINNKTKQINRYIGKKINQI